MRKIEGPVERLLVSREIERGSAKFLQKLTDIVYKHNSKGISLGRLIDYGGLDKGYHSRIFCERDIEVKLSSLVHHGVLKIGNNYRYYLTDKSRGFYYSP
jgi:hypothetical protein